MVPACLPLVQLPRPGPNLEPGRGLATLALVLPGLAACCEPPPPQFELQFHPTQRAGSPRCASRFPRSYAVRPEESPNPTRVGLISLPDLPVRPFSSLTLWLLATQHV